MLNALSEKAVNSAKFSQRFLKPCYDSYCFSNLPSTIASLLTGQEGQMLPRDVFGGLPTRYDKVIFFFVDAFGWRFFERYAQRCSFLQTISAQGMVSKLTSQFPSTTAAHVTCMHTGLNVGQSGIYEWNYYEPLVDAIISPLLFSYAGDKLTRDTIKRSSIAPAQFFSKQTFYQALQDQGVTSHIFQHNAYTPSTYSDIVFRGACIHSYKTLLDALTQLAELVIARTNTPTYYYVYFDRFDTACHNSGPSSRQAQDAIETFFTLIEQIFYKSVCGKTTNTLLMITADHGQIEVDPRKTYYLNKQMPRIVRYLKTNRRGELLVPAGSARDMFLHVAEEHTDRLVTELRDCLVDRAEVYQTRELLEQHFFGLQELSPTFLQRVGNVVILPYKHETVWWYEEGKFAMHFLGHHGGLTPEEMEIPLLLLAI